MAVMYRDQLGAAIRRQRKKLGLSQEEVADRMRERGSPGTTGQSVSRWERGANLASDRNLELIAEALEISLPDLMAGLEVPRRTGRPGEQPPPPSQLDRIEAMLSEVLDRLDALELAAQRDAVADPQRRASA